MAILQIDGQDLQWLCKDGVVFAPPVDLPALHTLLAQRHALPRIFWQEADDPQRLTKEYCCAYFERHPAFCICDTQTTHPQIDGLLWLDSYVPNWSAHIGLWFRFKRRGPFARAMSARFFEWLFMARGLQTLWGVTPWHDTLHYGLALGAEKPPLVLPGYAKIDGQPRDVFVLRLSRTTWMAQREKALYAV